MSERTDALTTPPADAPPGLTPGLHAGMPAARYHALPAVSQTLLKHLLRTPLHARAYLDSPPGPTEAQSLGTAAHCAVLEPERFALDYFRAPDVDRRYKAGKEAWQDALDAHPGASPLKPEEYDACLAMADAALRIPEARALLSSAGHTEASLVWREEGPGLWCKARPDRLAVAPPGAVVCLDPKTCRDASPGAFARDVAAFRYHLQAAFYLRGLEAVAPSGGAGRRFLFLALEKAPPYACALYELGPEALAEGRALVRKALATYAECAASGVWPGYPPVAQTLHLPPWGYAETDPRPAWGDE